MVATVGLLVVETALAVLGVLIHYSFTAEYGDVTSSAFESFRGVFTGGIGGLALAIVGLVGLVTTLVSPRRWLRAVALGVPVLMVVGTFAVTPAALQKKFDVQYDTTPQCVFDEEPTTGPGAVAARQSQEAFDSIDHVGYFGGGGRSGVGGCDRTFILMDDVDVLQHYRTALPEAGWQVVEDDDRHLRAERDAMAFEVFACDRGGVNWAGAEGDAGQSRCGPSEQ